MGVIPQLTMLSLVAVLNSSGLRQPVDFKMTSPDGIQRITQLWLVTYINESGEEVVGQAKLTTGQYAPLIAADVARLESMVPAARDVAKAKNLKMRLIKFTNRLDIEDITP
jgi:hypothetical protein